MTGPAIERTGDPAEAHAIRWAVFVEEQGIAPADELDGTDGGCAHWLLRDGEGRAVSTLRTRREGDVVTIGRVATLPEARGRGHARRLMEAAVASARAEGAARVVLGAQEAVVGWYEAMGFAAHGPPYDDAGIAHRSMTLAL